jgi:hypothetical protein
VITRPPLKVLPVLIFRPYERREATSWRWSGAFFSEEQAEAERRRIRQELEAMAAGSPFPLQFEPLQTVGTKDQAALAASGGHDVVLIYGAQREPEVIEALLRAGKPALMFVRLHSGPFYYMYIGVHGHLLRQRTDGLRKSGFGLADIVVDNPADLVWRLRALHALKSMRGKRIVTIEGLSQKGLHRIQKAWIEHEVPQCGYCQTGMIMSAAALLAKHRKPTDADIDAGMTNLCRCGTYARVREAIHALAAQPAAKKS